MKTETARSLRKNFTPAERMFWEAVRNRRFHGVKFLRQHPISCDVDGMHRFFVADFYCYSHGLVVEIDGGIHETREAYDALRTYIIEHFGFRVLRFSNEEVEYSFETVRKKLEHALTPRSPLSHVSEGMQNRSL